MKSERTTPVGYQPSDTDAAEPPSGYRRVRPKGLVLLGENEALQFEPELIRDTIPEVGVGFLGGQSGAWKSFFALHLAGCLATAEPLAGRKIERPGGVVYIAAEGGGTLPGRIKALRSRLPDPDARLPLYGLDDVCPLNGKDAFTRLEERLFTVSRLMAKEHDVSLVSFIIDTVAAAGMIGEDKENDAAAWEKGVFAPLRKIAADTNTAAILLHHFGKSAEAGLRGSSGIRAGADFVLALTCDRNELTGKASNHALALSKSRTAPEGPIGPVTGHSVVIGHRDDGSEVHSLVLEIGSDPHPRRERLMPKTQLLALEALAHVIAGSGERTSGPQFPGSVNAVRLDVWRAECKARSFLTESDKRESVTKAMQRVKNDLLAAHRIGVHGDFVWLAT